VVFLLILLFLVGNSAFGAPKAITNEMSYNAGDLIQGDVIVHDFVLKNAGNDPLSLQVKSCTCGGVKYETPAAPIAHGKSDKIRVSIPTRYLKGNYKRDILIQTNDPENKELNFTIQANIHEILTILPRYVDFGRVKIGLNQGQEIDITNNGKEPVTILQIEAKPAASFAVSPQGKVTLQPGQKKTLTLTFNPGKDPGEVTGSVLMKTDMKRLPEIKLSASAEVVQ
jgi:hypothetical protein